MKPVKLLSFHYKILSFVQVSFFLHLDQYELTDVDKDVVRVAGIRFHMEFIRKIKMH